MKVLALVLSLLVVICLVPMILAEEAVVEETEAVEPAKPLRFITPLDAPPFAYQEGLKKVGFEIELGEAIGEVLGRPVEWLKRPFNIPPLSADLDAGRADAVIASISVTPDREKYFIFTEPYFQTSLAAATYRDVDWDHSFFAGGLARAVRVGVLRRSTGETWARENLEATRQTFDTPARLTRALNGREVELILVDEPILRWELARRHYKFQLVERDLVRESYAIAVGRSNPELAEELNRALRQLREDGTYDRIYRKWYDATVDLPELGR